MSTGIAAGAACAAGQSRDVAAADRSGPSRPGPRRFPRNVVVLGLAAVVAVGALIAIVAFLGPLASAAGGCGGG